MAGSAENDAEDNCLGDEPPARVWWDRDEFRREVVGQVPFPPARGLRPGDETLFCLWVAGPKPDPADDRFVERVLGAFRPWHARFGTLPSQVAEFEYAVPWHCLNFVRAGLKRGPDLPPRHGWAAVERVTLAGPRISATLGRDVVDPERGVVFKRVVLETRVVLSADDAVRIAPERCVALGVAGAGAMRDEFPPTVANWAPDCVSVDVAYRRGTEEEVKRAERVRAERERVERARAELERAERERVEQARAERERAEREHERERVREDELRTIRRRHERELAAMRAKESAREAAKRADFAREKARAEDLERRAWERIWREAQEAVEERDRRRCRCCVLV